MISTMRKRVEPDVDTDEAPISEDVQYAVGWIQPAAQPLSGLGRSLVHLLQTEGAHVIFIGRRRLPGIVDGRPVCPDYT